MKKVLFVATVTKGHILAFHVPYLKMFKEMGWKTYVASKNDFNDPGDCIIPYCDKYYDIPFERSPLRTENIKAFFLLKNIIRNEKFDIIHCHTPVGGVIARLAALCAGKNECKVIYTAHGFHFFKGAPLKNWLLYYPVEKFCSRFTDVLITINKEDYRLAKRKMHAKRTVYVPGVGIDIDKFSSVCVDVEKKRRELGLTSDDFVILSVGELNENKNHEVVIKAISGIRNNKNIHYLIAGEGEKSDYLNALAERLNVNLHLLGFRDDVAELYHCADVFAFPSKREGLPVALMEAISCKLPVICSRIRGNTDLVKNGLFDCSNYNEIADLLKKVCTDHYGEFSRNAVRKNMYDSVKKNYERLKKFDLSRILIEMKNIYKL